MPTPISYCHTSLGHSGRRRGGPKCQRTQLSGLPAGPTWAPSASVLLLQGPQVFSPQDPGLGGTWMPPTDAAAPREKAAGTCALPWPSPGCHPSCIFLYFLTEWTLCTLTQGGHISVLAWVARRGMSHMSPLSPLERQQSRLRPSPRTGKRASTGHRWPSLLLRLPGLLAHVLKFTLFFSFLLCGFGCWFFLVLFLFVLHGLEPDKFSATP